MSTPSLQELVAQRDALERQIREAQTTQKVEAVAKVKALMAEYGLTMADIATRSTTAVTGKKVAAKYKSADGAETWSGRGLKPKWLKAALESGKKLEDFAV